MNSSNLPYKDHYACLSVPTDADAVDIAYAFIDLTCQAAFPLDDRPHLHDLILSPKSRIGLLAIQLVKKDAKQIDAYEVLSRPEDRKAYDEELDRHRAVQENPRCPETEGKSTSRRRVNALKHAKNVLKETNKWYYIDEPTRGGVNKIINNQTAQLFKHMHSDERAKKKGQSSKYAWLIRKRKGVPPSPLRNVVTAPEGERGNSRTPSPERPEG